MLDMKFMTHAKKMSYGDNLFSMKKLEIYYVSFQYLQYIFIWVN